MASSIEYFLKRGSTSRMIEVYFEDNAGKPVTGITPGNVKVHYFEVGKSENGSSVTTVVGDGTAPTYESNKLVEVDATNKPGIYKYSIPDAALALNGEKVFLIFDPSSPASANPCSVGVNLSTEVVLAADGVKNLIVENGTVFGPIDLLQAVRGISAVTMGTLTGADTPVLTFKGVDTATNRVIITTDEFFNRPTVEVQLS